jgi:hypothetical protein
MGIFDIFKRKGTLQGEVVHPASYSDFWTEFNRRSADIEMALRSKDAELLTRHVDGLAECVCRVDNRMNVTVYGGPPFRIGILAPPGAESIAQGLIEANRVPVGWSAGIGLPNDDPLEAVVVRDDAGATLRIAYDDLMATILPQSDGSAVIVFALDSDFDPGGPEKHLYQAAAQNVVNALLGGWPPQLKYAVMVPLASVGRERMKPVRTLTELWQRATAS